MLNRGLTLVALLLLSATLLLLVVQQKVENSEAAFPAATIRLLQSSEDSLLGGIFSRAFSLLFPPSNCPPPGFDALTVFNISEYISELWYPQKAAPVVYAPGQSYCSVVQYTRDESCRFFGCDKARIDVNNRGTSGEVNGPLNQARLKAYVPNDAAPAKIRVGFPQFLTRTNYWVVAADTYENALASTIRPTGEGVDVYDWAIIAGASPNRESNGKCAPGLGSFDTRGLWIFARDAFPPVGVVDAVTVYAESMGLDTSILIPIIHEGCTYDFLDEV